MFAAAGVVDGVVAIFVTPVTSLRRRGETPNLKIGDSSPCDGGCHPEPGGRCSYELSCAERLIPDTCSYNQEGGPMLRSESATSSDGVIRSYGNRPTQRVGFTSRGWGFLSASSNVSSPKVYVPIAR